MRVYSSRQGHAQTKAGMRTNAITVLPFRQIRTAHVWHAATAGTWEEQLTESNHKEISNHDAHSKRKATH